MRWISSHVALGLFIGFFTARYLRTIVSIITYATFQPKQVVEKPAYGPQDTTVIIPTTFKSPGELIQCLRSILNCSPAEVIIVTSNENVELVRTCCALNSFGRVEVLGVAQLNKRRQMVRALQEVHTDIVVFADDDVFWPSDYLSYLLAIFDDPRVGAGGTRQRVRRNKNRINCWNFLGISYLQRRVWNNVSTNAIDGSLSTLSGRTAAYRSQILQTKKFRQFFLQDSWRGRRLNSDDDKCLTRYVFARGWRITLQFDHRSTIETTFEDGPDYLQQCLRWARAHWRGNLTVMLEERYWRCPKFWWGMYAIYFGSFQTPALFVDGFHVLLLCKAMDCWPGRRHLALSLLGLWILFTKLVKLVPHFVRYPQDLRFVPLSLLFSYLHGFINLYALCTLHVTTWGSQNLTELERARAEDEEVVPLLRYSMAEAEEYQEPTPVRLMVGVDYFSARPSISRLKVAA